MEEKAINPHPHCLQTCKTRNFILRTNEMNCRIPSNVCPSCPFVCSNDVCSASHYFAESEMDCSKCSVAKAALKRPKDGSAICKDCFFAVFEKEIHETITREQLFKPGEKVQCR